MSTNLPLPIIPPYIIIPGQQGVLGNGMTEHSVCHLLLLIHFNMDPMRLCLLFYTAFTAKSGLKKGMVSKPSQTVLFLPFWSQCEVGF
ncbi:hypothetical protein FKM82_029612 [Ascaphus truei]